MSGFRTQLDRVCQREALPKFVTESILLYFIRYLHQYISKLYPMKELNIIAIVWTMYTNFIHQEAQAIR